MVVPRRVLAEASPGRQQVRKRRPALAEAGRRVVSRDSLPSLGDGSVFVGPRPPDRPSGAHVQATRSGRDEHDQQGAGRGECGSGGGDRGRPRPGPPRRRSFSRHPPRRRRRRRGLRPLPRRPRPLLPRRASEGAQRPGALRRGPLRLRPGGGVHEAGRRGRHLRYPRRGQPAPERRLHRRPRGGRRPLRADRARAGRRLRGGGLRRRPAGGSASAPPPPARGRRT